MSESLWSLYQLLPPPSVTFILFQLSNQQWRGQKGGKFTSQGALILCSLGKMTTMSLRHDCEQDVLLAHFSPIFTDTASFFADCRHGDSCFPPHHPHCYLLHVFTLLYSFLNLFLSFSLHLFPFSFPPWVMSD